MRLLNLVLIVAALAVLAVGMSVGLAGCGRAPAAEVAVDACLLREYLRECEGDPEMVTPGEQDACRKRAPAEATRVLAAVPPQCRTP